MNGKDAFQSPGEGSPPPQATPRAIALMNQKGGVGKTTTTVNLGAAFAERGRRVLLVDLDPQAHLTLHLGIEIDADQPTMYDLLIDPRTGFDDVLVGSRTNLDVIPSETDLAGAELELSARPGREFILGNKLRDRLDSYEIVLFDCPPSLGILTLNALATTREVFVPMQAHFLPLQGVGKLLETVGLVCENVNRDLRVSAIILCAHEGNTTLSREIVADLESFFNEAQAQSVAWNDCRILEPAIRRNVKLAEAPSFGKTIFEYDPTCNGAEDYRTLADNLLAEWFDGEKEAAQIESRKAGSGAAVEVKPDAGDEDQATAIVSAAEFEVMSRFPSTPPNAP